MYRACAGTSLCSERLKVHSFCAQGVRRACMTALSVLRLRVKVHPHCAQTARRACMGTRTVLRLWAKSASALCSDCFFLVFFPPAACNTPQWTRNKKSAAYVVSVSAHVCGHLEIWVPSCSSLTENSSEPTCDENTLCWYSTNCPVHTR